MALGPAWCLGHRCTDPSAPPLVTKPRHSCSPRHRLTSVSMGGESSVCSHRPGVTAGTLSHLCPVWYRTATPAAALGAWREMPSPRPGLCCNLRASAGAQGQACKTFIQPAPHPCKLLVGSQRCPPPGTLERRSAQASESLESREHWERGEKRGSELNITTCREDLPSPELTWTCPGIIIPWRGAAG